MMEMGEAQDFSQTTRTLLGPTHSHTQWETKTLPARARRKWGKAGQ